MNDIFLWIIPTRFEFDFNRIQTWSFSFFPQILDNQRLWTLLWDIPSISTTRHIPEEWISSNTSLIPFSSLSENFIYTCKLSRFGKIERKKNRTFCRGTWKFQLWPLKNSSSTLFLQVFHYLQVYYHRQASVDAKCWFLEKATKEITDVIPFLSKINWWLKRERSDEEGLLSRFQKVGWWRILSLL